MIKIQPISALSCVAAILVALSPGSVFANDRRSGIPDDSIKPTSPQFQRSGIPDDSIKPTSPQFQRSGIPDDSIKPVFPKRQRLNPSNEIVRPVVPKQPLPARKTTTGQNDDGV